MNTIKRYIIYITAAVLCCGCFAAPAAAPTPASSWDERLNATARAVVAATFFAPTLTPTPTATATVTQTPTLTAIPSATPAYTPTFAFAGCIPAGSQSETGRVVSIIDGETIRVEMNGQEYTVRYAGINAPEDGKLTQPFGEKATGVNRDLVEGRTVLLVKDKSDTDRLGRLPRYVYAGNIFVNYELVRLGLATARSDPPDTACFDVFHQAEHEASIKNAGVWSKLAPTKTPLDYGRENKDEKPCDCYGEELDCDDFSSQMEAQGCYNYCNSLGLGDLFDLAVRTNGRACIGLP